jgi:hypothetical protein
VKPAMLDRLILCVLPGLLSCGAVVAAECVYRGVDADARVVRDSGEMFTPTAWISDTKCERLSVVSGSVQIVNRNAEGRIVKRTADAGRLATGSAGGGDFLFHAIGVMLAGDERVRAGRSRGFGASLESIQNALPSGLVAMPDGPLVMDVPITPDEAGASFALSRDGVVILQTKLVKPTLVIPAGKLAPDGRYQWVMKAGPETASGQFTVVSAAAYATARAEIDALNKTDHPASAEQAFKTASALLVAGYAMEARKVIRAALEVN